MWRGAGGAARAVVHAARVLGISSCGAQPHTLAPLHLLDTTASTQTHFCRASPMAGASLLNARRLPERPGGGERPVPAPRLRCPSRPSTRPTATHGGPTLTRARGAAAAAVAAAPAAFTPRFVWCAHRDFFAPRRVEEHPPLDPRRAKDPRADRRRRPLHHTHSPPLSHPSHPPNHPSPPPLTSLPLHPRGHPRPHRPPTLGRDV